MLKIAIQSLRLFRFRTKTIFAGTNGWLPSAAFVLTRTFTERRYLDRPRRFLFRAYIYVSEQYHSMYIIETEPKYKSGCLNVWIYTIYHGGLTANDNGVTVMRMHIKLSPDEERSYIFCLKTCLPLETKRYIINVSDVDGVFCAMSFDYCNRTNKSVEKRNLLTT